MKTYSFKIAHVAPQLITLEEVKNQLKIELDETFEDDLLNQYRDAAIKTAEDYSHRNFNQARFQIELFGWENMYVLPKSPVSSIDKFEYLDAAGIWQTLPSEKYELKHEDEIRSILYFEDYAELPSLKSGFGVRIKMEITVGYAAASDLPEHEKTAIFLLFTHYYNHREDTVKKHPSRATDLLKTFYYTVE